MTNHLVSVIMTTYNVEKYINRAIDSILEQTHKQIELIIVDDDSSDNTTKIIQQYNDPRIKLYKNKINSGSYFCKNYGITQSKGDYITLQDADDYSTHTRLEKQLIYLDRNPEVLIVKCQYVRVNSKGKILTEPKAAFPGSMIRKSVFKKMGFYDTVRVAADDEFDCRAKLHFGRDKVRIYTELMYYGLHREDSLTGTVKIGGPERVNYVENFTKWHKNNSNNIEKLHLPFPHTNRLFDAHKNIQVKDKTLSPDRFIRIRTKADMITASVASFPKRINQLEKVVNDILPQVDQLIVYLNEFSKIPNFLNQEKITVNLGENCAGNISDNGKFYNLEAVKGFHITIDDDINYPKNYISKLTEKLEQYSYLCVVGVHGIDIIYDTFKNYYEANSRIVYTYGHKLIKDKQVHILGTGTVAYHSNLFQLDFPEVVKPFMIDIFFAIQVNRKNIPMVCIDRKNGWLKDYETDEATKIYNSFRVNDEIQSKLVLEHTFDKPTFENSLATSELFEKSNIEELTISIENLTSKLNETRSNLQTAQTKTKLLQHNLENIEKERKWYGDTYDHLPWWFLKVGAIFRRVKVKKGF